LFDPPFYKEYKNRSKNKLENYAKVMKNLEQWINSSVKLLNSKGIIFLIITSEILDLVLHHLREKTGSFKIFPFWPNYKKSSKRIILVARKGGASSTELMSGLKLYNKNGLMTKKAKMISEVGIFNY
jgi:tRNA1(Val) A37 N6-methylase TrmN6